MKKIFVYGFATLLLSGCLVVVPNSQVDSGKVYQKLEDIAFVDTNTFDNNLSGSMSAKTEDITIKMLAPASINEIPRRLNKWLSAVSEQKGHVYIEPKTTSMSSIWALSLLPKVYKLFVDNNSYNSAGDYNATIFYNLESGMIKKVVFSKK